MKPLPLILNPASPNLETPPPPPLHTAPEDYEKLTASLTFSPMINEVMVTVTIVNDDILEDNETFTGNLDAQDDEPVKLDPSVATVTIFEDQGQVEDSKSQFLLLMVCV